MMSIEEELAALAKATTAELVERYEELHGTPARIKNPSWLRKRLAWKVQERRYGGLSQIAKQRIAELVEELDLPFGEDTVTGTVGKTKSNPAPGTVIVRHWRGKEIIVTVLENGVEWNGEVYRSLSAVARAITGSRWNGRLFFGLTPRRKAR